MKTYQKLAEELRKVGLDQMAKKADEGYYHDFLSPLTFPEMQLVEDLGAAADNAITEADADAIRSLRVRVINGDFDADLAESEEWMASEEGQDALSRLVHGA